MNFFISYKNICLLVLFPFFLYVVLIHVLTDRGAALVISQDFPTGCFGFVVVGEVECAVYR